ncbi:hypothetical protein L2E82_30524 [Cichorium intybus]|uniref:Uncharacterized protein n=1 Tax=Cichorium intybus TaxID=13427 RepID=A0ACB9D0U9_CICIN|nr:hypothetical protein L2E82_30524 [Cichorium intybus]
MRRFKGSGISEDDFVYKRLNHLHIDPTVSISSATPPPERNRNERKNRILLKLKTKYQLEIRVIHRWEHSSNSLKALQDCTQTQPLPTSFPDPPVYQTTDHSANSMYHELVETLLVQVEAQEATINEASTLCHVAESHCTAKEKLCQYLPIW